MEWIAIINYKYYLLLGMNPWKLRRVLIEFEMILLVFITIININVLKYNLKELKTKRALSARDPQLFDMRMPSISLHPLCEFSGASATRFLSAIFFSTFPLYSTNKEKHSSMSCVSFYTSFMFQPLPVCLTTEQSTVKASLFVTHNYLMFFWYLQTTLPLLGLRS